MGVVARKTFSHTLDEAMSDGLAKACGLGKMYSVKENISHFIDINEIDIIYYSWVCETPDQCFNSSEILKDLKLEVQDISFVVQ